MSKPAAALRELLVVDREDIKDIAISLTGPDCTRDKTPNQSSREGVQIDTIVIHCTAGGNTAGAVATLKDPDRGASAHIVIPRWSQTLKNKEPRETVKLVPDNMKAWHVRKTLWFQGKQDVNARSLGVEIVNTAMEDCPYTEWQIEELLRWCRYWAAVHPIKYIVTHAYLDPERRSDPCVTFPWDSFVKKLLRKGDGDNPTNRVLKIFVKGEQIDCDAEIQEGSTWAEIKPIIQKLGFSIKFDPEKYEIRIV